VPLPYFVTPRNLKQEQGKENGIFHFQKICPTIDLPNVRLLYLVGIGGGLDGALRV
jgi:hypothetical protein